MKEWLNKEYVVKRKMGVLLFEALMDSILFSIILYLLVSNYNSFIVELLNSISANNLEFLFIKIMFPFILIVIAMFKIGFYIVVNGNNNTNTKASTKTKTKTKKKK